jgi:ferredoxin-NADP reductase
MEDGVVSFVFKAPAEFTWQPGQYVKYTLVHDDVDERGTVRWFTIASAPYENNPRITTRIEVNKGSSFKRALMALKPGDAIEADTPEGDFILGSVEDEYVFIAGGIGFTPFHAILSQLDHQGSLPKITVLYGARDDTPTYHEQLAKLQDVYSQLELNYIVEPQRIDKAIIQRHVNDLSKPLIYVSGPEPMVEAFDEMLKKMGVLESNLRMDYFPGYDW